MKISAARAPALFGFCSPRLQRILPALGAWSLVLVLLGSLLLCDRRVFSFVLRALYSHAVDTPHTAAKSSHAQLHLAHCTMARRST
jgi:hypothetical protein